MKFMRSKKGADTRALDILFSIPIIVLLIILFYVFLGQTTIEKQESIIQGDVHRITIDDTLSKWALNTPTDFTQSTSYIENTFAAHFQKAGFVVDDIDCEKEGILRCEFDLEKGEDPEYVLNFQRTFYLPFELNALEIRIVGELTHE